MPAGLSLCVYRVVQEALTNTLKHAGATRAEVNVSWCPDALELKVIDGRRQSATNEHQVPLGTGLGHARTGRAPRRQRRDRTRPGRWFRRAGPDPAAGREREMSRWTSHVRSSRFIGAQGVDLVISLALILVLISESVLAAESLTGS